MNITDDALDEFIVIYKEKFTEEISRAEMQQMASSLLMLYGRLARKVPSIKTTQPSDDHPQIGFRTLPLTSVYPPEPLTIPDRDPSKEFEHPP
jgi:hypothetical protein